MNRNKEHIELSEEEIDVSKILFTALQNWYLFAGALIIALGFAWFYNWYAHPIFRMNGTVLVKDDKGSMGENLLAEMGALQSKRNIENEIEILRSRSLMGKALNELDMEITYILESGIRQRELYKASPIELEIVPLETIPDGFNLETTILDSNSFEIDYLVYNLSGEEEWFNETHLFNEDFELPFGHFRMKQSDSFDQFMKGSERNLQLFFHSNDALISKYLGLLKVQTARTGSSILTLSLEERVKQKGVDVLDKLLDVYMQNSIEQKNQLTSNSLRFIDAQLDVITKDLSVIESDMQEYKTDEGITDLSAEAEFFLGQVGQYDQQISGIEMQLSFIDYLEKYIKEGKEFENSSPASIGINDPLLAQLITRLSDLEAERGSLLKYTKSDNPMVTAIDSKISNTKKSLLDNVISIRDGLLANKTQAQKQLSSVESKVKSLPGRETELVGYQRKFSIKENLYLLLLEKKSENSILLASTVSDNLVIDRARSTILPIKPVKSLTHGIALILALILPAAFLLVKNMFDNKINDRGELQRITSIPLVGMVNHNDSKTDLVVSERPKSPIAEAFRGIRTNLQYFGKSSDLGQDAHSNVFLVTSSIGSEGKSFCSINLSTVFALGGKRTILLGMDLRKPKLSGHFENVSRDKGASGYLAGIYDLDECIQTTGIQNFDIMISGEIPPNPSELIMSKRMDELVNELSERYDYVVMDTPPIGLVTDGLIMSKYATASIYVVRQGFTLKGQLDYVNDLYKESKMKNLSILFNAVKYDASRYGYSYGYGYGYGYYDSDDQSKGIVGRVLASFKRKRG
ncbi:MAG: tyrosine-protein kinase Etk/Wzc [Granulosicoccus sp.]|jgi:tyrosine-protein kinase Etk/Wzc